MTFSILPDVVNVIVCTLIIVRIIVFRKKDCRHKPAISLLAWSMSVSCCVVITALLSGFYRLADCAEIVINSVVCISLHIMSGNLSNLLKSKD
ncbi:phage holin family protein [Salmonella enterica subsp. enterica]|nr:phage holin family protein [Salmonella enterica subsp. enterica serovar Mikawasima]EDN7229187.1 phage holin family protein [Salmonella enterica subsp. enterica serovar Mikawasima]